MNKIVKILLITLIIFITVFGISIRREIGMPIIIKNLILIIIVIPLIKYIWNIPNANNQQSPFSNQQQAQGGFNQGQNTPQSSNGSFGGYNGGHNGVNQPQNPSQGHYQSPQSLPQPKRGGGKDFDGDLYGKAK